MMNRRSDAGFTLIEIVISIVIIGASVVSVVGALSASAARSAEVMVRFQASNIANAYLAEILSLPFNDPVLPNGETIRATLDDVFDYNNRVDNVARDRTGLALTGLGQYSVSVTVANVVLAPGAVAARRVDVIVQPSMGGQVVATGFRTDHP